MLNSTATNILKDLRDNLIIFLDELIEIVPSEANFVIIRVFVKDEAPMLDIVNFIIQKIFPIRDKVKRRDESFFLDNDILFAFLNRIKSTSNPDHFKNIWNNIFTEDDKATTWLWFDQFIRLTDKYIECIKSH